jgi:hypothetical protein
MKLSFRPAKLLIRWRDSSAVSFARWGLALGLGRDLDFAIFHLAIGIAMDRCGQLIRRMVARVHAAPWQL